MPFPSTLDVCRVDLFTAKDELSEKYPPLVVDRVLRIRDMYNYMLANPDVKDKTVVDTIMSRYNTVSRSQAYEDVGILKTLVPMAAQNSRDFHRWRYGEMILETYQMAKKRKDTKTMERAATSYAKYFNIDKEDERLPEYEKIVVQPFIPTLDPTVLGLEPIPNVFKYIEDLTKEMSRDMPEIMDVQAEEADLMEDKLFGDKKPKDSSDF